MLEILMVMAIVGVLSSLALPKFQEVKVQREVNMVARQMVQQMEAARVYAQTYGVKVQVCPVASTSLNEVNPHCSFVPSDARWGAWIWVVLDNNGVQSAVLSRSDVLPSTVTVSMSADQMPSFNGYGLLNTPIQTKTSGFSNFLNRTINIKGLPNNKIDQVVLAPTGRISVTQQ